MVDVSELRGIWVYRSFLNNPVVVVDFGKIAVWEAELSIEITDTGRIFGMLGERPETSTGDEPYLYVEGQVGFEEPFELRWRATGKPGSEYDGWIYDYVGFVAPSWQNATSRRPVILGTVTRTIAHGTAPAGSVFSFVAVKCDFVESRRAIPLAKPVIDMMASAEHRFLHALWHASRDEWVNLSDPKKEALRAIGWQPGPLNKERPSLSPDRLKNGSGEDFLYMHRRMVQDVRAMDPNVSTWRRLPQPQFPASFAKGMKSPQIGNLDGYAVPLPWVVPGDPDTTAWLVELRRTSTLYAKFQEWETLYTDPHYLATLSLGELGSRVEFTVHNWMHMRWASVPRDPTTDKAKHGQPLPSGRAPLDFDPKWIDPEYDHLGETFSSHVNPIFWRLHGWVDDRIEDWFKAQEAVRPGIIKRAKLNAVDWFQTDGTWVVNDDPWEGARAAHGGMPHPGHGHMDHGGVALDVPTMQKALIIIYGPEPGTAPMATAERTQSFGPQRATWFKRIDS